MTNREKVVMMAYTGICTLTGDKLDLYYRYLEELFGRPVFSHEIPSLMEEIQKRSKPEFIEICQEEEEEETHEPYYQVCVTESKHNYDSLLPYHFSTWREARIFINKQNLYDNAYVVLARD